MTISSCLTQSFEEMGTSSKTCMSTQKVLSGEEFSLHIFLISFLSFPAFSFLSGCFDGVFLNAGNVLGGGTMGAVQAAKAVMADMRKHNPVLVEEALLVSREMIKVRRFYT